MPLLREVLEPARALARNSPGVVAELARHGIQVRRQEGESRERQENRIATVLMARYRDGRDPAVFEALHAFAAPGVLLWIRGLLGRESAGLDPREVLQDTFVNVYRYPGSFREEHAGSFRVWVRTIAGNVIRRGALARARAPQLELESLRELVDQQSGPVQAMLDQDEAQRLRGAWMLFLHCYAEAWKELGQRDRRTLHLVEIEGLSYQEAGRILDVGRSNLKMIVFRARRRLARRLRQALSCSGGSASALVA